MDEIESFVRRAKEGDLRAFDELVRRFQNMTVGYAYSMLRDFGLAEDAAQDAFVRAFMDIGSLRQPKAFAGLLRRITFKYCQARLRRKSARTVPAALAELPSRHAGPADRAQQRETQKGVVQAIRGLPAGERAVTSLFYISGNSQQQISEFLGVPLPTVKTRLHRARARLQKRMIHMVDTTLKGSAPDDNFRKAVLLKLPKLADQMGPTAQLPDTLDAFQANLILEGLPKGSEILELGTVIPIYRYPLVAHCRLPGGRRRSVEVHAYAHPLDSVQRQARLLGALAELGLPVQEVLAGPTIHPDHPEAGPIVVLSRLDGRDLPFVGATAEELDLTCRLIIEGTQRLQSLTAAMEKHPVGRTLPRRTLIGELDDIEKRGGPWIDQPIFRDAVTKLRHVLAAVAVPLVFSNGLNISWNYLYDGQKLTGFQLFERSCFEDPHIQFAKYKYWGFDLGWSPFARAGLVERWLYEQNISKAQFAPRLALRCLYRLQECIPVGGGTRSERRPDEDQSWDRERASCLSLLRKSLEAFE